jgi:hypothetical protein
MSPGRNYGVSVGWRAARAATVGDGNPASTLRENVMLKTAMRMSGIGLAVCGLAVAVVPAALAATPTAKPAPRPVTQTLVHASALQLTDPCNGAVVVTAGKGLQTTITDGQHTTVAIADVESGDGFAVVLGGTGSFTSLSSSYSFPATATYVDLKNLADSFHSSFTITVSVSAANAPLTAAVSSINTLECGL